MLLVKKSIFIQSFESSTHGAHGARTIEFSDLNLVFISVADIMDGKKVLY